MKHKDMRSLPRAAQEERRRQVIGLRESGMGLAAIGRQVGLSQTGVFNICQRYRLASRPCAASRMAHRHARRDG